MPFCGHKAVRPSLAILAAALAACLLSIRPALAANDVAGAMYTLNDNGAWSWFEDERAIIDTAANKLIVSSVANGAGTGGAARSGDIEVESLDLTSHAVARFTLHDALQADDHDSAALWRRTDGRYVASYSKHGGDSLTRFRISTNPGDISAWGPEQTFTQGAGATYSNLHFLSADNGGGGRLYDISRTVDLDPHVIVSSDQGQTWSAAGRLLNWPLPSGDPKYTGTDGSRPYLKYASNGVDEIHFITSTDHPRGYDNSIYAGVIKNGKVYDSFGNVVDDNLFDGIAKKPTDYTTVWNTDTSPLSYAWTTDLQLDSQGHPYALFTARHGSDSTDHRFLYAHFTGTQWDVHEIAKAGGYLYASENDYTGLGALDPTDPDRLFISTKIDPRTQVAMPHYEIFEGTTTNGGANWAWTPITFNSTVDNLRPIVPKWDIDHTALLWMRGSYSSYTNYDLDIVALTNITSLVEYQLGDLDRDEDVDLDDFALYLGGLHANLSGLTAEEAYMRGDLNGDLVNDFRDFVLFRGAYDMAHGAGSLEALAVALPEPAGLGLLALGGIGSALARNAAASYRKLTRSGSKIKVSFRGRLGDRGIYGTLS
jgi:hypothetical protein